MKTLKENYKRNVEIMRENLRRGMSVGQATSVINAMRKQFVRANLYGEDEKYADGVYDMAWSIALRIERDNGEFSDIENVVEIIYNAIKYGEGV